jgi:hypothetical protein
MIFGTSLFAIVSVMWSPIGGVICTSLLVFGRMGFILGVYTCGTKGRIPGAIAQSLG